MKKSYYELRQIIFSENYTRSRQLMMIEHLMTDGILAAFGIEPDDAANLQEIKKEILGTDTEESVLANFENEDRDHWLHYYSARAAADLLSLGKIQPETLLQMTHLPGDDFETVIKMTTVKAKSINAATISAEQSANLDTIPPELI